MIPSLWALALVNEFGMVLADMTSVNANINIESNQTKMNIVALAPESYTLLLKLAHDTGNWSGTPLVDVTRAERGNLSDLKQKGLLTTFRSDNAMFVDFAFLSVNVTDGTRRAVLTHHQTWMEVTEGENMKTTPVKPPPHPQTGEVKQALEQVSASVGRLLGTMPENMLNKHVQGLLLAARELTAQVEDALEVYCA